MINKESIVEDYRLVIDEQTENFVRGWAASAVNLSETVVLSLVSGDQSVAVICDKYRPDVARAGLHKTGFCGFFIDLKAHNIKKPKIHVAGIHQGNLGKKAVLPIAFVHIPKTAGTSLRKGFHDYFDNSVILQNYGRDENETTPWLKSLLPIKNSFSFLQNFKSNGCQVYLGHFYLKSCVTVFPHSNFLTMLRNPVDQVISHFNHFKRWHGYKDDIFTFVKSPQFKNIQAAYLKQSRVSLLGFVGITERYNESIDIINRTYNVSIPPKKENVNSQSFVAIDSNSDIEKLIIEQNEKDIALYEYCSDLMKERLSLSESGHEWVYGDVNITKTKIVGCAYYFNRDDEVIVQLKKSGKVVDESSCITFRGDLLRYQVPRSGHVGFSFNINDDPNLYTVVVKGSGQSIPPVFVID